MRPPLPRGKISETSFLPGRSPAAGHRVRAQASECAGHYKKENSMNATTKEFIDYLRSDFYKKLSRKTGWGKNEIISVFEKCVSDTLAELLDRKDKNG